LAGFAEFGLCRPVISDGGAASGASARARRLAALSGGREAEIVDLGDGTVLRRYRSSGSPGYEALVMEHARKHGFPVPEVVEVRDNALVLERIDGPTMLHELRRRPWHARRHMRTLAELHKQLHAIEAPAGIDSAGDGDTLLHLDFHPLNVLLSVTGPVVIDWPNARSGDAALDVAMTWVICATSGAPSAACSSARICRSSTRTRLTQLYRRRQSAGSPTLM
jgi:aminoglycoside phosphotransferase (APT) family kinase protein